MLYLANASSPAIRHAMAEGELGQLCSPAEGRDPEPNVLFGLDNSVFGKGWPGYERWWSWVQRHAHLAHRCLFVTAPDVVGDAAATLTRSAPWLPRIQDLGLPAALVGQDGLEDLQVPWDTFSTYFVGGSTNWKLSSAAAGLVRAALRRGKHVHVGRVNSGRRWRYCEHLGAHSVDGTFLTFGPDKNLPKLRAWRDHHQRIAPV